MNANQEIAQQLEALQEENTRLKHLNDLKTGWISLLSHDFKEAFLSISILIEAYENKSISQDDFFSLLPQIKQDCQKNLKSISDTAEWIKTQFNGFNPMDSKINVAALFTQIKLEFQEKLQHKNIQLSFQGDEHLDIKTNEFLLSFILKNVIDNAIKYSHPKSEIVFKSAQDIEQIKITIGDKGIGMNEKQVNQIFTFDAAVFHGTQGEIGAGLSLKIVKYFVNLINGVIEITSSKDNGTLVILTLPINTI